MPKGPLFRAKSFLSILVLLGLAAWAVIYFGDHLDEFVQAMTWEPWFLAVISILILAHFTILGLFSQVILKVFGLCLEVREWFGLAVITTLGNYLLPLRGGAALRATYLKKKHGFPLTHFLSTFLAIYALTLMVNSLAGLLALAGLPELPWRVWWTLTLFFAAVFVGTVAVTWFPVRATWFEKPGLLLVGRLIQAWRKIRGHHHVLLNMFSLTIANSLSLTLMIYFGYKAMGLYLGLAEIVLMGAILALTGLVSLTPGGLGVQEAVVVFSAHAVGISPAQGFALAVAIRATTLFWTFLLGLIFSYLLLKKPVPVRL